MRRLALFLGVLALPALAQKPPLTLTGTAYPITGNTARLAVEKGPVREIRLWGITLPKEPGEQIAARDRLDQLAAGKRLSCEERWTDGLQIDALCIAGEVDVGLDLILAGLVKVDRRDLAGKPEWNAYCEAESAARAANRGIWAAKAETEAERAAAVPAPATSESQSQPTPSPAPGFSGWLYRWQTLIAGALAFLGGLSAYLASRRYVRAQAPRAVPRRR